MADKLVVFKEHDVAALKEMVKWWRTFTHRDTEEQADHQHAAQETYIALVPSEGIQGLTGIGIGGQAGDMPGANECQIYQIINGELTAIAGLTKTVYSLSPSGTPPGWTTVTKDKFGRWIAVTSPALLIGKTEGVVTQGEFGLVDLYDNLSSPITNSLGLTPNGLTVSALFLLGSSTGASFWVLVIPIGFGYIAINIACLASTGTST